ncbi:MAG: ABC transporter ATP-binding protein [Clostridia bacterium]
MNEYILEMDNVSFGYRDGSKKRMILKELSYSFEKGRFYTILGPSGSGKTTLLSMISALDVPESGSIRYEDKELKKIGYGKYRRNHMAIIFQKYNLIDYLTGLENVEANMDIAKNKFTGNRKEIAYKILSTMGIVKTKADRRVTKLSGGEQQRIAIARALAKDVDLILGDEPTGSLDTATSNEVIDLFKHLASEYGKTIILVTHSDDVAAKSDISLRIEDGKLRQFKEEK